MIGVLLVCRSGLVEQNAVEVFHHYGFRFFSLQGCVTMETIWKNTGGFVYG